MVSLWLGFAPAGRRALFTGGLTLPALVLGVSAWWSAWQGQRSQFGYSNALRQDYRPAESAGPAFARLAGLPLPPDIMMSLEALAMSLPHTERSEEHTSELQSPDHLVCRLLLEKKKNSKATNRVYRLRH